MQDNKKSNDLLFHSIKEIINRSRSRVYQVANSAILESYWEMGKLIVEHEQSGSRRAEYGKSVLKTLAKRLTLEVGSGYDESNLRNIRQFYLAFSIRDALRHELSWTHYRILSRIDSAEKRLYYLNESAASGWSSRTLQRQIASLAFERVLPKSNVMNETPSIQDFIKDPYIFEFLQLPKDTRSSERTIETAIIDHLQQFLLEFGKGFAFVARQEHIATDTSDFYIDLVFYNYLLKCFVIIDLKTGPLSHQDIGQIDMYVRMYDDLKRGEGDNPTIGILLCSEKDETIVKYSVLNDRNNLFASKYLLFLPKEEELKEIIERDRFRWAVEEEMAEYGSPDFRNFMYMKWQDHIVSDKEVLLGKPTIKGTRISIDHIFGLLSQGWTEEQILSNYPRLTKDDITAVFAYVHECMKDGLFFPIPRKTA